MVHIQDLYVCVSQPEAQEACVWVKDGRFFFSCHRRMRVHVDGESIFSEMA